MKQALWQLFSDLLSAILFLICFALSGDVRIAAGVAVAAGLAQIGWLKFAGRPVEPMQWTSLALVLVLGGTTMLTQNPRFLMIKPSIVHFAVAVAMLRRGWMIRYITPIARQKVPEAAMVAAGYAWAALMAALGLANLVIALYFDFATWAWFVAVGAVGAKLAAVAMQFVIFRMIVRRRLTQPAV
jgi:intracellular septation protein A